MKYGWVLILGACALVYANSLTGGFHYDDEHSILHNINIRSLENIPAFFRDPGTFSGDPNKGMYRPLLLVTYALNYAQGQYEVYGYHLVNILLHGLNACLVWWLARLLAGRGEIALAAGLLFALHPLGSEPVNYISSRSESLVGLFFLLGLGLFISGHQQQRPERVALSWGALALGLLSKSTAIVLPALLVVYDYLFISKRNLARFKAGLARRHLPGWGIAAGYLALIWLNGFLSGSVRTRVRGEGTQLLTQLKAFVYYLQLLLWPARLNVEHQFSVQETLGGVAVWGGLLLAVSCLLLLFYLYRRRWDRPLFLWLWGLLPLLPVMVMPLNVLVNERRLYLTGAAFCVGLALLLGRCWRRGGAVKWLAALVVLVYGGITLGRNAVWKDDFSLWEDAAAKAPQMPRVHLYLGNAHKDAALLAADSLQALPHWQAAAAEYQRTIELNPQGDLGLRALNNLGAVYFKLDDIDAAERAYRQAVDANPQYADGIINLGSVYHERGRRERNREGVSRKFLQQAIFYYQEAMKIEPNHPLAYANLGLAYFDLGDLDQALKAYERAYYITPWEPVLLSNMGNLFITLAQRQPGEGGRQFLMNALQLYQQSVRLNPANAAPQQGLKQVEAMLQSGYW